MSEYEFSFVHSHFEDKEYLRRYGVVRNAAWIFLTTLNKKIPKFENKL